MKKSGLRLYGFGYRLRNIIGITGLLKRRLEEGHRLMESAMIPIEYSTPETAGRILFHLVKEFFDVLFRWKRFKQTPSSFPVGVEELPYVAIAILSESGDLVGNPLAPVQLIRSRFKELDLLAPYLKFDPELVAHMVGCFRLAVCGKNPRNPLFFKFG